MVERFIIKSPEKNRSRKNTFYNLFEGGAMERMEKLRRGAILEVSAKEGKKISEQLERRNFVDLLKRAKDRGEGRWGVRNGEVAHAAFCQQMGSGELTVALARRLECAIAEERGLGKSPDEKLKLAATFCTVHDRRLSLLIRAYPDKRHAMSVPWSATDARGYGADLVPDLDASVIIARCISLESALASVLSDPRQGVALDALEIIEKFGAAAGSIGNTNTLKSEAAGYIQPLAAWANGKVSASMLFLRGDPDIMDAFGDVADK